MSQSAVPDDRLDLSGPALLVGLPGHDEALALGATRLLAAGRPQEAFLLADRLCRLFSPPPAPSLALRALALWRMGEKTDAVSDLARALTGDPGDPVVARAALQLSAAGAEMPDPSELVAQTASAHELVRLALSRLLAHGRPAVARLDVLNDRLTGWFVWTGEAPSLALSLQGEGDERSSHRVAAQPGFPLAPPGTKGAFVDLPLSIVPRRWALAPSPGAEPLIEGALWPRSSAPVSPLGPGREPPGGGWSRDVRPWARSEAWSMPAAGPSLRDEEHGEKTRPADPARFYPPPVEGQAPSRRSVVILIPVFEDFEATQDCLRAAVAARSDHVRVLVVDDASPNRRLKLLLDALAARGLIELLRNPHNLGFAGAVNRGLDALSGEDVLLLNSDAVLPPGALARLADIAYGEPDIGSVSPLSNQGEFTSFPARADKAAPPSLEDARRIDALAASLQNGAAIDLPAGSGFCLFLRHDALAAVARLSTLYGRGYFEDLDLCLRLRAKGFRNVAAPGIFVSHAGSRSFGSARAALVSAHRRLAAKRNPAHREEAEAFAAADPLRPARSRLEAALVPPSGGRLVVFRHGDPAAEEHLVRLRRRQTRWLALDWRPDGEGLRLAFQADDPAASHHSLELTQDSEWRAYLGALRPASIDLVGAPPPEPLFGALRARRAPIDWLLEGPGAPALVAAFGVSKPTFWRRLQTGDEGTHRLLAKETRITPQKLAAKVEAARPVRAASRPTLGILLPAPGPREQAFLGALSAAFRARVPDGLIVVLGRAMDEAALFGFGNVVVTGLVGAGDLGSLTARLGLCALALPPGAGGHALFERLRSETGLPAAFVDPAARPAAPAPHLFMDPTARDRDTANALVHWFPRRLPPPPA